MNNNEIKTLKQIFIFWIPLAITWLFMSVEGPYLSAIIARLAEPKLNLAAFGVAFSLAIFIEAPIIMIMTAATALVKNRQTYIKLRNFNIILNSAITFLMLILIIRPVFDMVAIDIMQLDLGIIDLTWWGTLLFLPWPAAIGFRRFYQGVLINYGQTKKVAYGTATRLISMSASAYLLFKFSDIPGVAIGAISLSAGVVAEAIATWLMSKKAINHFKNIEAKPEEFLSFKYLWKFYYPLLLTSLIAMGARPFVTFFMARAAYPIESLAVLPIVTSLVFIFRSVGIAYQEVLIALMNENRENLKLIKKFALRLGIFTFSAMAILALTPLANWWFGDVSGLTSELTQFAKLPLIILLPMPALAVLVNVQRGLLVYHHRTKVITLGTAIEFGVIVLVAILTIGAFDMIGAIGAVISFLVGRIAVNFYFEYELKRKKYTSNEK